MIDSLRQRHDLSVVTPAAILGCVGWIDIESHSASFFRFAEQLVKKFRPRGIMNAHGKTMVMGHPIRVQVFHADDSTRVDNLPALLVGEIVPPEANTLMHGQMFSVPHQCQPGERC